MTISDKQLDEWERAALCAIRHQGRDSMVRLKAGEIDDVIQLVRRLREAYSLMQREVSKRGRMIEEQRLDIGRLREENERLEEQLSATEAERVVG